jgi:flagellar biogenesis protein FliO
MNRARHGSLWAAVGRMFAVLTARAARGLQRRRSVRRLRLSETLSLGEKRFLAVVQFQRQEFLVGGTGNSIALLAKLDAPGVTPESRDGIQEDGL